MEYQIKFYYPFDFYSYIKKKKHKKQKTKYQL